MKRILLTVIIAIIVASSVFVIFVIWASRAINEEGQVDTAKNNLNSQIAEAVGRSNVQDLSELLEIVRYPGVNKYRLSRDRNFDHNWSHVSFETNDGFDKMLSYYQEKFPGRRFSFDSTPKGGRVAYFTPINEPGKIGRSFLFFTIQEPVKNVRMSVIEGVDNITSVSVTRTY